MELNTPLKTPAEALNDPAVDSLLQDDARRAARNAAALALSNVSAKGLLFVWQLLLARLLGA